MSEYDCLVCSAVTQPRQAEGNRGMDIKWAEHRSETNRGEKQVRLTAEALGAAEEDGTAIGFTVDWLDVKMEPIVVIQQGITPDHATPTYRYLWLAKAIRTVMSEATGRLETLRAWLRS